MSPDEGAPGLHSGCGIRSQSFTSTRTRKSKSGLFRRLDIGILESTDYLRPREGGSLNTGISRGSR